MLDLNVIFEDLIFGTTHDGYTSVAIKDTDFVLFIRGTDHDFTADQFILKPSPYIYGGTGNDVIYGTNDNDIIYGGAGSVTLHCAAGADYLVGGSGRDVFSYNALSDSTATAMDTISDFNYNEDRIDFGEFDITHRDLSFYTLDGNTYISINNTDFELRLNGENHILTTDQFIF